ncbi:MAG: chloramphenicol phosphotransferase CPT family protein [Actinomycetota bacterium]|nr:chloramphenicol phosphotransferase CPT family protein [Actinomycetota bacterium]MDQ2956263.1 chloramphenicol phosphotransferase CPT family protein [Actinomycetota bacterium]
MRLQHRVIVLNGISSAGKSTIARQLQSSLDGPYLVFGTDTLIAAMPEAPIVDGPDLIRFEPDGTVAVTAGFRTLEASWYAGLAAIAQAGTGLIIDEVLLGGGASQARLADALAGLDVVWVAVRCDLGVATAREANRADRVVGMAASQFPLVHDGVSYDLAVDTTHDSAASCATRIVTWLDRRAD